MKELSRNETAGLDARLLLMKATGLSREALLREDARQASHAEIHAFQHLIIRRKAHEPMAYILGEREFWGLDFAVTRDTLIPRPDSETLISASLSLPYRDGVPKTVLDLGTGTGCLLIALLTHWPASFGIAVDVSESALTIARANAERHRVLSRADFFCGEWMQALGSPFDLVIGNPPYVAEADRGMLSAEVGEYEPHGALFAGADGLADYRRIAAAVRGHLAPGGFLVLEIGQGQAEAVARLFDEQGMRLHAIEKDLAGIPRCMIWTH